MVHSESEPDSAEAVGKPAKYGKARYSDRLLRELAGEALQSSSFTDMDGQEEVQVGIDALQGGR